MSPVKGRLLDKLEEELCQMEVGETGYTLPWAVSLEPVENNGVDVFLNIRFPVHPEPRGTLKLYVKRTGPGKSDFEVDLDSVKDYKWSMGKTSYVGASEEDIAHIGRIDWYQ